MAKKIKAEDLIENASKSEEKKFPSKEALAELQKLIDHNDQLGTSKSHKYIPMSKAIQLLRSWGFACKKDKLTEICQVKLGRRSYRDP